MLLSEPGSQSTWLAIPLVNTRSQPQGFHLAEPHVQARRASHAAIGLIDPLRLGWPTPALIRLAQTSSSSTSDCVQNPRGH